MRFVKVSNGEHCPTMEQRITSESDCILAASALGLEWALSWNGVNDVPGCIFADDGRSLVYWNSAQNNNDVFNSQYAEICHQLDSNLIAILKFNMIRQKFSARTTTRASF